MYMYFGSLDPEGESGEEEESKCTSPFAKLGALIGQATSLVNFWRFPYLVYYNGGGAFLIPYLIFLIIVGIPLCFMELTLGQSTGIKPFAAFGFAPLLKGLGWTMILASLLLNVLNNTVLSWLTYYYFQTLQKPLPWSFCNNTWNTPSCFSYSLTPINADYLQNRTSSTEEYFYNQILNASGSIYKIGVVDNQLAACGFIIIVALVTFLVFRLKTHGMTKFFAYTLALIIFIAIIIHSTILPGSSIGMKFLFFPDWSRLKSTTVWITAAFQVLYTVGPAWGILIFLSSRNAYSHNFKREAIAVPLVCGITSILSGVVVFSVLGHMAYCRGRTDIRSLVEIGPGITLIAYTELTAHMYSPSVAGNLIIAMLITYGFTSKFTLLDTILCGWMRKVGRMRRTYKTFAMFFICAVDILITVPLLTQGGIYYFQLLDWYTVPVTIIVIVFLEVIAFSYVYGVRTVIRDAEILLGPLKKLTRRLLCATGYFIMPGLILTVCIMMMVNFSDVILPHREPVPQNAKYLAFSLALIPLIPVVIFAEVAICRYKGRPSKLFTPSEQWLTIQMERQNDDISSKAREERMTNEPCNFHPQF